MTTKFKILIYCNQYVDFNRLFSGIYYDDKPVLLNQEATLESIAEQCKTSYLALGIDLKLINKFIDNLKECELMEVEIKKVYEKISV